MNLEWPFFLESETAIWPTLRKGRHFLYAGRAHLYEHLFFRRLKKATEALSPRSVHMINGRTQTDHLYVYRVHVPGTTPESLLEIALTDERFRISPHEFLQERNIVMKEIDESASLTEILVAEIQSRFAHVTSDHRGVYGTKSELARLDFDEAEVEMADLLSTTRFLRCRVSPGLQALTDPPEPRAEFGLKTAVMPLTIQKKHVTACVFEMDNPDLFDFFRLQIIDQILRHLPGPANLNTLVRDTFGAAYGFHGVQIPHGRKQIFALSAFSNHPAPEELLRALESHLFRLEEFLRVSGQMAIERLWLEDRIHTNPLAWIHRLPHMTLRFGALTQHLISSREELLQKSFPMNLELNLALKTEAAHVANS